jgi:hypothetical protein
MCLSNKIQFVSLSVADVRHLLRVVASVLYIFVQYYSDV